MENISLVVEDSEICEWKCDAHPFGGRFVAGAEAAGASNTPLLRQPGKCARRHTIHSLHYLFRACISFIINKGRSPIKNVSGTSSYAVFVYFFVFVCLAHGNMIFDILE